ncbi:hypothetical protein F4861DRAFT_507412 [Xylaria intraflava]|nr:hypothetical protein F4861DRAFT_507412 [Xylaria intraflava]
MDLSMMPAAPPPPGMHSNFVNPVSQQPTLVAASAVVLVLTLGGIGARTYTKAAIMRQFDITDGVLLLCGALFVSFVSVQLLAGKYGQGRHLWDVTAADFSQALLILNIIEILYGPTMFCAKYVVLRQIETVFFNHHRKGLAFNSVRILIWANFFFYFAISLSFILACVPRSKISNPLLPGMCIDTSASIIATSAINVVSDFTILITPITSIWSLQLPLKKKLAAGAVFAVGILANATSIVRLYFSIQLTRTTDISWAIIPVASWALGEFTGVILVACFPYFPRLYQHFRRTGQKPGYIISNDGTGGGSRAARQTGNKSTHWKLDDSFTGLRGEDSGNEDSGNEISGQGIRLDDSRSRAGTAL